MVLQTGQVKYIVSRREREALQRMQHALECEGQALDREREALEREQQALLREQHLRQQIKLLESQLALYRLHIVLVNKSGNADDLGSSSGKYTQSMPLLLLSGNSADKCQRCQTVKDQFQYPDCCNNSSN